MPVAVRHHDCHFSPGDLPLRALGEDGRIQRWRRGYLTAEYTALFFGGATLYNKY